jgi:hypothetical protein
MTWRSLYLCKNAPFYVLGSSVLETQHVVNVIKSAGLNNVQGVPGLSFSNKWPSKAQIAGALVFTDHRTVDDIVGLGNQMADYVDAGGGAVVAPFANCNNVTKGHIAGRWASQKYDPILQANQTEYNGIARFIKEDPGHFLIGGVTSKSIGYYCPGKLHPKAKVIAKWGGEVKAHAVVELSLPNRGRVVTLNFFPPSCVVSEGNLLANSLIYTSHIHERYLDRSDGFSQ